MIKYKIILFYCFILQTGEKYGAHGMNRWLNYGENGQGLTYYSPSNINLVRDFVINITVTEAEYNKTYEGEVYRSHGRVYQFPKFPSNKSVAVRITMSSNKTRIYPILFVIREPYWIQSWQVPLYLQDIPFQMVSRTLCPAYNTTVTKEIDTEVLTADVSTSSPKALPFRIMAELLTDFILGTNNPKTFTISPSQPQYFLYVFPDDVDLVFVRVTSPDYICMVVSIQDIQCPVFDLVRNVQYTGTYQKMTRKSGITVEKNKNKKDGNKFYVVFVVELNEYYCKGIASIRTKDSHKIPIKTVTVQIEQSISKTVYIQAIFLAMTFFLSFFVVAGIIMCIHCCRKSEGYSFGVKEPLIGKSIQTPTQTPILGGSAKDYGTNAESNLTNPINYSQDTMSDTSSIDEKDIDMLDDADSEKDVFRTKTFLYVSDLARKNTKRLSKKYKLYYWNLITIVVLYALPVIQLVITYQKVLHESGDQDICYYNFFCAHPFGMLSSFNTVFSNIGYVMLGILFLGIVCRRDLLVKKALEEQDEFAKNYGIPNHFGLFYAMGIALVMEGVFSGCYHICPNYSNFQFDTSFMYMIAGLCMLKIYQIRHPDINAKSSSAYLAFAATLFIGVIGVMDGSFAFWVIFTIIHVLSTLALSAQIYYMGRWKLNLGIFKRIYLTFKNDFVKHLARPMYMDRMILLLLGNAINWSLAIYGAITRPRDFATHLLEIFMLNLMLYVIFYVIMKIRSKERILPQAIIHIALSMLTWGASLYFFSEKHSSWESTPAVSKEKNSNCILLDFYDSHDVWHFLSACGMFFSFMILLTLDDDLVYTRRDQIAVF